MCSNDSALHNCRSSRLSPLVSTIADCVAGTFGSIVGSLVNSAQLKLTGNALGRGCALSLVSGVWSPNRKLRRITPGFDPLMHAATATWPSRPSWISAFVGPAALRSDGRLHGSWESTLDTATAVRQRESKADAARTLLGFPPHVTSLLILPQPNESGVPQMVVRRPLDVLKSAHQLGFQPPAFLHLLGG
jgi:hypothetical protein